MTPDRHGLAFVIVATAFSAALGAQEPPVAQASAPLQVQIVISRYQGDRKVSSLPYTLSVNPDNRKTSLRMGAQVPIPTTMVSTPARGEKASTPIPSYTYQSIGTNIDCTANPAAGNQYRLSLEVEDSSVYPDDQPRAVKGVPMLRSFKFSNTLLLRDGQSTQLTSAADKVSGEVLKVDVTVSVVK